MGYIGADGRKHTPYMIHRALFGSVERFAALLIEHYMGDFPLWFAPVQFALVPINKQHNSYCKKLELEMKKATLRVEPDYTEIHMREKIKRFETMKIPYIIIIGDRETKAGGFSVRSRRHGDLGIMNMESLSKQIKDELDLGIPQYIAE